MVAKYTPEQGDIILMNFNPQSGHEQKGQRPALVVSNRVFNKLTNLALVCPITLTERGFPLHVAFGTGIKTRGFVMCEQVKSIDLVARQARFVEKAPEKVTEQVFDILYGKCQGDGGLTTHLCLLHNSPVYSRQSFDLAHR